MESGGSCFYFISKILLLDKVHQQCVRLQSCRVLSLGHYKTSIKALPRLISSLSSASSLCLSIFVVIVSTLSLLFYSFLFSSFPLLILYNPSIMDKPFLLEFCEKSDLTPYWLLGFIAFQLLLMSYLLCNWGDIQLDSIQPLMCCKLSAFHYGTQIIHRLGKFKGLCGIVLSICRVPISLGVWTLAPQWVALFWKDTEPLHVRALLEEMCH